MLGRLLSRGRARSLARQLAGDPSAANYLSLAQSHVTAGRLEEVIRVCDEALGLHPDHAELRRMKDRALALGREDRIRELQRQIRQAPRPALFRELCEALLEAGKLARAEKVVGEWFEACEDDEALLQLGTVRAQRYLADRRRDDARVALDRLAEFSARHPGDARPLRSQLEILTRCGAWADARTALARLLELAPGDPQLEARFRTVAALSATAPPLDQALREVERTGRFVDDVVEEEPGDPAQAMRPALQAAAEIDGVRGAFYVRGGTALVQGPRGASAERSARGIREVVSATRSTARRLGYGQLTEVLLEGDFGSLLVRPDALGAAALWLEGEPGPSSEVAMSRLAGGASPSDGGGSR